MKGSDRHQSGVIRRELHHLDKRPTGFRTAVEKVMAAAARAPAPTAAPKKAQRIPNPVLHPWSRKQWAQQR